MQKIINSISLLCVVIILIIATTVNEGMYGTWLNEDGQQIFEGNVNIVKLRAKDGAHFPHYTLIYDENYHASACQKNDEEQVVCLSLLLKTTNIHPSDEISSVVAAPLNNRDYILETKIEYHLGYNLLLWKMMFPQYNNQVLTQVFRRNWI